MSEESQVLMHYFTYNVHTLPHIENRISVAEFNDGIEALLKRKEYTLVPGTPDHIKLYTSSFTNDKYLIIVSADPYHFFWYVADDESLIAWRQQYERTPLAFFPKQLLPPPPTTPKWQTFPMNIRALRGW